MKKRNMNYRPVVTDKATRALSIETIEVPGQNGTFLKAFSKDNTPVLVPVSSLEAMRNLVNLNIRPREDSTLTRAPDMKGEKQELKRYLDKLEVLVQKLDHPAEYEEMDEFNEKYSSIEDSALIHNITDKKMRKSVVKDELDRTSKDIKKQTKMSNQSPKNETKLKITKSQTFKDLIRKQAAKFTKKDKESTRTIKAQPVRESDRKTSLPKKEPQIEKPTKMTKMSPIVPAKDENAIDQPTELPRKPLIPPRKEPTIEKNTKIPENPLTTPVDNKSLIEKPTKKSTNQNGIKSPTKENKSKISESRVVNGTKKTNPPKSLPIKELNDMKPSPHPSEDTSLEHISCSQIVQDLIKKAAAKITTKNENSTDILEIQPIRKLDRKESGVKEEIKFEKLTEMLKKPLILPPKTETEFEKQTEIPTKSPILLSEKETNVEKPPKMPDSPSKETADKMATKSMGELKTIREPVTKKLTLEELAATDVLGSQASRGPGFRKPATVAFDEPNSFTESKDKTLRFFIYGYVKNYKPVFLIQSYKGDSLLGGKKSHLDPKIYDDGIDVMISGKFYPTNILKEWKSTPKCLTVENRKILIDNKSIMFEEGVTEALSTDELLIVVRGSFIKHKSSFFYTPSLFIGVERNTICKYNPISKKRDKKARVSRKEAFVNSSKISTYTIETRGFKLFHTRTEGGETIYEASPLRKPTLDTISDEFTTYKEQGIYENHPKIYFENQSLSRTIENKTEYGDEVEDVSINKKIKLPSFNKNEIIVYECGKYFKSKSENYLLTGLSMPQSKTEYGDIEANHAKSAQEVTNYGNGIGKIKHRRRTDLLKRLNKIMICKLRHFNEPTD